MYSPIPIGSFETLHNVLPAIRHVRRTCLFVSLIALAALTFPLSALSQDFNVAYGPLALDSVTNGNSNTAVGFSALTDNIGGNQNTASGAFALHDNTTGVWNTACGVNALGYNITGDYNTASGVGALFSNKRGNANTGNGCQALFLTESGGGNTGSGYETLFNNNTGSFNTSDGYRALYNNRTGFWNTATGYQALYNNVGGSFNIALGVSAGGLITTGSSNIDIGNSGVAGDAKKIRIGTKGTHHGTFIAGISGVAVTGSQVAVNSNGKLGVAASSAQYKESIKAMDNASEAILQLEPVTFRYKEEIDPEKLAQFGLIAEQVEKVNPDLVVRNEEGKVATVRYEAVNAMLLNEFLKEHRRANEQRQQFEAKFAQQQQQIEALTAGLQKVNRLVETNKPVPQFAAQR